MEWFGIHRNGIFWKSLEWNGLEFIGMEWFGIHRNGIVWNSSEWNCLEFIGMEEKEEKKEEEK